MADISILVDGLTDRDNKRAYGCLKELLTASERDNEVYKYIDSFMCLLDSGNSYVQTRGILLIATNAKWDEDNRIDEVIDKYLHVIKASKPIFLRQSIKVLPKLARSKPDLQNDVVSFLKEINVMLYADSMQSLLADDIKSALVVIQNNN